MIPTHLYAHGHGSAGASLQCLAQSHLQRAAVGRGVLGLGAVFHDAGAGVLGAGRVGALGGRHDARLRRTIHVDERETTVSCDTRSNIHA